MSTDDTTNPDEPKHAYETEDSFHPLGAEWEEQMRDKLEETDYDADLGMQMARDAQRMVAGEISEEEFYAEYHDDVEEEFEMDARPIFDDLDGVDLDEIEDESMLESLADVDLSADDVSRRDMLKKMGAGGLFMGYAAYATADNQDDEIPQQVSGVRPADEDVRENRWGMVIDLERCDHCLSCVAGCINENGTSTGANWMYVFAYEEEKTEETQFLVRPCQHCSNAPCAKVCPVRARHTREKDGLVLTNYETCIGCRYCQVACPYGVNYFQWGEPDVEMGRLEHADKTPSELRNMPKEERNNTLSEANDHVYDERGWWTDSRPPMGVMGKCTMCPSRQDEHTENEKGSVACMDACDQAGMSAIHFGDLDAEIGEDYDRPQRYLERRREKARGGRSNRFDANFEVRDGEEGNFSNVDSPERNAFQVGESLSASIDPGYYTMYLAEREDESAAWQRFDSAEVLVAETTLEDSEAFGESQLNGLGGLPSAELDVLYSDADTDVTATLRYGGEEATDVTASLVLGGDGETIASQDLTISPDASESVTFEIGSGTITSDDGAYVLTLVVESDAEDGDLAAARRGVYLSTGRPNVDTPDADFNAAGRDGNISQPPTILFKDRNTPIEAMIEYPEGDEVTREIGIVISDGTDAGTEAADVKEQVFNQEYTSNTAWSGKISTFKLLDELGTQPNITYVGNPPNEKAEPVEPGDVQGAVGYEGLPNEWGVHVVDERLEHLEYGATANRSYGSDPHEEGEGGE